MEEIEHAVKFGKDFMQGAWDTIIVAPFKFGMFLGNLSGFAGEKQKIKAELELEFTKKALSAFWNNTNGARDYILKELDKDYSKRPGYYIGAFITGLNINAPSTFIKIGEKTVNLAKLKVIIGQSMIYGGKADMLLNEMYDKFLKFTSTQPIFRSELDFKENIDKNFYNYLNKYKDPYCLLQLYDPLVLDLNGDFKISTLNLNNGVFFDHNNDNIAYKSSWISKDDGLLVLDKNNNNLIDNGNELFGNFTEIPSSDFKALDTNNNQTLNSTQTTFALNGFEALKLLDSNKDGVIDINDKEFNNLKVWQDLNEDGITGINELKILIKYRIKSISLNLSKSSSKVLKDNSNTLKSNIQTNNSQISNVNKTILVSKFVKYNNTIRLLAKATFTNKTNLNKLKLIQLKSA